MIICVLNQILHKIKSISMQLLESPIPPLTAAALRMIICKRPVPLGLSFMCSEPDFTQDKVNFHATPGIPNSSSYCCCPLDDYL